MAEVRYFERVICKYIPLDQVIGKEEKVQWTLIPSKQITARILINNAKIQHGVFLLFFIILDITLILISVPPLIQNYQSQFLIFSLLLITISSFVIVYLLQSFMHLKESKLSSLDWFSEYSLTDKKLYLKMTRFFLAKKHQPVNCKIRIIDLRIIRAVNLYKSFWDKRYKETASFKIKLIPPYSSITLHNLPEPESFMNLLSNTLNSTPIKNSSPDPPSLP